MNGSVGNCSGGITPWGTALSCEENFSGYGTAVKVDDAGQYGWHTFGGKPEDAEYDPKPFKKYGWVCEHDPYDPDYVGRKHTALGRFRHENTAFRHEPGKQLRALHGRRQGQRGRSTSSSRRASSSRVRARTTGSILEEGQLYIARWEPEGRRRFAKAGDTDPVNATEGTGTWEPVALDALDDTATKLRAAFGAERVRRALRHQPARGRGGARGRQRVRLADQQHQRRDLRLARLGPPLREQSNDPEALEFRWRDYAAGGPTGSGRSGPRASRAPTTSSSTRSGNLWVVTDISSSRLNKANEYAYHKNNAHLLRPDLGPEQGRSRSASPTAPWTAR